MSISIIGAGNVGIALGRALVRRGESVVFGVPVPEKYRQAVANLGNNARLVSIAEAIASSRMVILAVPFAATEGIARSVENWQGKVLVDASNPLAPGASGLLIGTDSSGAETLATHAQGARVVKAFNTTGAENMADSAYPGGTPIMPVCGDDEDARRQVLALATLIGFDALDFGPLRAARYLEPFAMAWIHLAIRQGHGRQFAFARLRRS